MKDCLFSKARLLFLCFIASLATSPVFSEDELLSTENISEETAIDLCYSYLKATSKNPDIARKGIIQLRLKVMSCLDLEEQELLMLTDNPTFLREVRNSEVLRQKLRNILHKITKYQIKILHKSNHGKNIAKGIIQGLWGVVELYIGIFLWSTIILLPIGIFVLFASVRNIIESIANLAVEVPSAIHNGILEIIGRRERENYANPMAKKIIEMYNLETAGAIDSL